MYRFKINIYKIIAFLFPIVTWGPPTFRSRSGNASLSGSIDLPIMIQLIFWAIIGVLCLFIFFNRCIRHENPIPKYAFKGSMKYISTYAIICLISITYSISKLLTIVRGLQLLILIYAISYMNEYEIEKNIKKDIVELFIIGLLIRLFVVLILVPINPSLVIKGDRLLGGEAGDITLASAILSIYYLNEIIGNNDKHNKNKDIIIFIVSIVSLFFTRTRVSIISTIICIVLILLFYKKTKIISVIMITLGVPLLIMTGFYKDILLFLIREQESVATLSGRTHIWEFIISESKGLFFYGYGYAVGARYYLLNKFSNIHLVRNPGNAHNAFFESVLNVGWIASGILLMSNIASAIESVKLFKYKKFKKDNIFIFFSIIIITFHNITTVGIGGPMDTMIIFYVVILAQIQKIKQRINVERCKV